jgi:hypothetical protein
MTQFKEYFRKKGGDDIENIFLHEDKLEEMLEKKIKETVEFNTYLEKMYKNDEIKDYFEVCRTKNWKYLVRKRPYLDKFLE